MVAKKRSSPRKQATNSKDEVLQGKTDREKKIMNCIMNTSIILMSTMMGAFTEVMINATGAMASGIAEALGGKEAGEKANKDIKQKLPEADEKMKKLISDIRKDIYKQMKQRGKEIKPLLSDPTFDVGPKIVEKYDFKLPKLTEELDDSTLAHYSKLLVSEDTNFAEMFKELTSWLGTLPQPPKKPDS